MLTEKLELLKEFDRPKVVLFTEEEIARSKNNYIKAVISCALENAEPDEFGKVVSMERVRGELTEQQAKLIMCGLIPEETERVIKKIELMHQLGLTWKDL